MTANRRYRLTPRIVIATWLLTAALAFAMLPRMAAVSSSVTAPMPTPAPAPALALE